MLRCPRQRVNSNLVRRLPPTFRIGDLIDAWPSSSRFSAQEPAPRRSPVSSVHEPAQASSARTRRRRTSQMTTTSVATAATAITTIHVREAALGASVATGLRSMYDCG